MATSSDVEAQREAPIRRSSHGPVQLTRIDDSQDTSNEEKKREEYGDTSATYWKLYLSEADCHDKEFVDSLTKDAKSMILLMTLFASFVASFIIEASKTLLPDAGQQTVALLSQLVQKSNTDSQDSFPPIPELQPYKPSTVAIRMNIIMYLSLFFTMMGVLGCILIQQWCREFMKYAYPRAAPHKSGRVRSHLFQGLDKFQIRRFMYGIHMILHASIFLFFWAVSDFLHNAYSPVGTVAYYCLIASLVVYAALSVSPLIFSNSPYHTWLTTPLRFGHTLLRFLFRMIRRFWQKVPEQDSTRCWYYKGIRFDRDHFLLDEADTRATNLDPYAMRWLLKEHDFSDVGMDKFLEGLPGYIHSRLFEQKYLTEDPTVNYILTRVRDHFMTCATSLELSEEAWTTRVSACVNSFRLMFKIIAKHSPDSEERLCEKYLQQGIINDLNKLCEANDSIMAIRASCVRGLAFHDLLSHLARSDEASPKNALPVYLLPLYKFLRDEAMAARREQHENGDSSVEGIPSSLSNDSERMWKVLLHDGPLVNLVILGKTVLLYGDAHPLGLSLCWRTLDILLKELRVARTEVSKCTRALFEKVHRDTRKRVQDQGRGFRITPLLEILDAAARGRRLSMVLLGHPEYHGRVDVFEKGQLLNSDLLEAFANCLPDYIAKMTAEKARQYMEDVIREHDLWTILQVHLWNSLRSGDPTPDKLRILVSCCTVVDVAFMVLEDSRRVDWRAPDFGSVAQHFDMFITHCFQGTFIGRAIYFRVGLLMVRLYNALLSQFFEELDREGTVLFRSQWDVASLARLFDTLQIGNEEDAHFWKSFINGGHIGVEFVTRARERLKIAVRDGPLLNFCELGRLAVTAVPFDESGLEHGDIEKLRKLQMKMTGDQRLPLHRASAEVWTKLIRLRDEVSNISSKSSGKDKDILHQLLTMIDQVYRRRSSNALEGSPSEHAEAEPDRTRTAVQPDLSQREQSVGGTSSTAVTPVQHGGTLTSEHGSGVTSIHGSILAPRYSPHNGDTGSYHLALPSPIAPRSSSGGIFGHTIVTPPSGQTTVPSRGNVHPGIPSVITSFSYISDTGQHHTTPNSPRRDDFVSGVRSGCDSNGYAVDAREHAIGSSYDAHDLRDTGGPGGSITSPGGEVSVSSAH